VGGPRPSFKVKINSQMHYIFKEEKKLHSKQYVLTNYYRILYQQSNKIKALNCYYCEKEKLKTYQKKMKCEEEEDEIVFEFSVSLLAI